MKLAAKSGRYPGVNLILHRLLGVWPIAVLLLFPNPALAGSTWTVADRGGVLGRTAAPVAVSATLTEAESRAAQEGRLGVKETSGSGPIQPVQWQTSNRGAGVCLLPEGEAGRRVFEFREIKGESDAAMRAAADAATGQIDLTEEGKPVLRYNYHTNEPGGVLEKVSEGNRIYARARSDYIHPLYGLQGEVLTRDWSVDHPHHRGIYWAWPEVDFGTNRGDLHALQKVFARPTGRTALQSGPVFAQIEAENQWLWEDREPIVRELAVIRAYRARHQERVLDLAFQFTALKEGVTVARRGTDHYGGLNVRLETPKGQVINFFTNPSNAVPRRAWSNLGGEFAGAGMASGLAVLQSAQNPDYPGDWVQYPELSWAQPTFPAAGSRYPLRPGQPLVLRFRLVIHVNSAPNEARGEEWWDAYHAELAPVVAFDDLPAEAGR